MGTGLPGQEIGRGRRPCIGMVRSGDDAPQAIRPEPLPVGLPGGIRRPSLPFRIVLWTLPAPVHSSTGGLRNPSPTTSWTPLTTINARGSARYTASFKRVTSDRLTTTYSAGLCSPLYRPVA